MPTCSKLLDIDLDAFVTPTFHGKPVNRRQNKRTHKPWSEGQLIDFLEGQCGLSASSPIPGRYAVQHDAALSFMEELVDTLANKLDVVHIDAHADLGMGAACFRHLSEAYLSVPLSERRDPLAGAMGCNPSTWLLYAVAEQLCSSIVYVHPPGGSVSDLPFLYFQDNDLMSGAVQLKEYTSDVFAGAFRPPEVTYAVQNAKHVEPPVPFQKVPISVFSNSGTFDYAFVCQSPSYTPATADPLIGIIERYVRFDAQSDPRP